MHILGIPGSLREKSYNKGLLRVGQEEAPKGCQVEIFDLSPIPPYNQDLEEQMPKAVIDFKTKIEAADAILIATAEYNYSIPGVLKNAIDWGSRPYGSSSWNGKPVAVMGASPSVQGTSRSQYHLRQVFITLKMFPLMSPELMIGSAQDKFDADGNLKDPTYRTRVAELLQALVGWTQKCKGLL